MYPSGGLIELYSASTVWLQVILCSMPRLRHLNVSTCGDLTDNAFLLGPSEHNKPGSLALTSVDMSGCGGLTNVAVKHLTEACGPSLRSINLSWTEVGCLSTHRGNNHSQQKWYKLCWWRTYLPVQKSVNWIFPLTSADSRLCHMT